MERDGTEHLDSFISLSAAAIAVANKLMSRIAMASASTETDIAIAKFIEMRAASYPRNRGATLALEIFGGSLALLQTAAIYPAIIEASEAPNDDVKI